MKDTIHSAMFYVKDGILDINFCAKFLTLKSGIDIFLSGEVFSE